MKFLSKLAESFAKAIIEARESQEAFNKNMEAAIAEHGLTTVSKAKDPSVYFKAPVAGG